MIFGCIFLQDVSGGGLGDENVIPVEGEDGQHYVVLEVIQMGEGDEEDGENQLGHEVDGHDGKVKVIAGSGGHPQVHKSNTEIKKKIILVQNFWHVMLQMCKCKL